MKSRDELAREVEVLGSRIATLSAAVLRLGSSLDLVTVLQEAADSARTLTNARYSLIVTIDQAGEAREFVTSSLAPEEHRELAEWRDGPQLFAYLRDLPGSFRLADLTCPTGSGRAATPTSWCARRPCRARPCATAAWRSATFSWQARRTRPSSAPRTIAGETFTMASPTRVSPADAALRGKTR